MKVLVLILLLSSIAQAQKFHVGDKLQVDTSKMERWQRPSTFFLVTEVGKKSYRLRSMQMHRTLDCGGTWGLLDAELVDRSKYHNCEIYRGSWGYPCEDGSVKESFCYIKNVDKKLHLIQVKE